MQRKWRRIWERHKTSPDLGPAGSGIMKTAAKCLLPPLVAAGIMLGSMGSGHAAAPLPTGGVIVNGNGTITVNGNTMTVNQSTAKMIANWESFSIGSDGTVNFVQPNSRSVALNRVLGSDASGIYGHLNANGQVFLINESGILFSPTSQVNVGGLAASALNMADSDFLAGNYKFTGSDSSGPVVNQGAITATTGGYIALMGPQVKNEGILVARQGTVALGAGKAVTLDMNGDGLLNLAVDEAAVNASVANHQLIQADGGQVVLTARAAGDLVGTVVNNSGIIQARSIGNTNGVIRLDGGNSGVVTNSGTLDASGRAAGQTGGEVTVLGDTVKLDGTSKIDVAGDAGGGTVSVGGTASYFRDYNFWYPLEPTAVNTTVADGATINADALTAGTGGAVAILAKDTTVFNGTVSARGDSRKGVGGSVLTLGQTLTVGDTAGVITTAAKDKTGLWQLTSLGLAGFTIAKSGGNMTGKTLSAALANSNVGIETAKYGFFSGGDLTVNDAVSWGSSHTLELNSPSFYIDETYSQSSPTKMYINAPITAPRGGLSVSSSGKNPDGLISSTVAIDVDTFINNGYWRQVAAELPGFSAAHFSSPNGVFIRALGGDGSSSNPYQLTDSYGLQGVGTMQSKNYILANDIDLFATKGWNDGAGFKPIKNFTGSFDGAGHTIANLYIHYVWDDTNVPNGVGLFQNIQGAALDAYGQRGSGIVRNLRLTNVDVTGDNQSKSTSQRKLTSSARLDNMFAVGGLVGVADSATIDNVLVTGKVTGVNVDAVGGLAGLVYERRAGENYTGYMNNIFGRPGRPDSVSNSYSTAAVTARGGNGQVAAGGLIGEYDYENHLSSSDQAKGAADTGYVRNSYSSGPVTVINTGSLSTLYAGGLVGLNQGGSIDQAYSTGAVTVSANSKSTVYAGGLVGASTDYVRTQDAGQYKPPTVTYTFQGEKISNAYSSGKVSYNGPNTYVGGFAGLSSGAITNSYCVDTSGQTKGIGTNTGKTTPDLTRLTRAQAAAQSSFAGWKFSGPDALWYMLDGYTTPFLRSEWSTKILTDHQLQLMAMDPTASYTLLADLDLREYNMAPNVGFAPIDNFSGSLDGQGHTVSYLNIHDYSGGDAVGLFARATSGAAIHDIALANATVSGTAANQYAGILAGVNDGSIDNVFTGGTVSGSGSVGGVAGKNTGSIATAFSAARVTGPAAAAGGLAGDNSGTVSESYLDADCSVNGTAGGPLAGSNTGTVTAPTYSGAYWVSRGGNHYLAWTVAPDGTVGLYTPSQLQAIQNYLSGSYRLRADLDLAGRNWTAIGTAANNAFTGTLDGGDYGIANLTIANSALDAVGLFGYTRGAALNHVTLTNVSVAGSGNNRYVGGLVGYSDGGSITTGSVGGTVTAAADGGYAGGLAGYNSGYIAGSVSAATVTATGAGSAAGGLAGANAAGGRISASSNTGAVTAAGQTSYAGGLAGQNADLIDASFNTGAVTVTRAGSSVGGIAGSNSGDIGSDTGAVYNSGAVTAAGDQSFAGGIAGRNTGSIGVDTYVPLWGAPTYKDLPGRSDGNGEHPGQGIVYNTGTVTALGAGSSVGGIAGLSDGPILQTYNAALVTARGAGSRVGGIAGDNRGSIVSSFFGATASGEVARLESSGANSRVGGIAGVNSGSIADTMSFAVVSSTGRESSVGGLVGDNSGSLATSYALGAVQSTGPGSTAGALIGSNAADANLANLIWHKGSSGQAAAVGNDPAAAGTAALTYAEMLDPANWSGFTTNWLTESGAFPRLTWQPKNIFFGLVNGGGPGLTVNKYDYDYTYGNVLPYKTTTFGADGLYFMTSGASSYNSENRIETRPRTVLFTVTGTAAGRPYKANSIYVMGLDPMYYAPVFYDLYRDTLLVSIPQWTSGMQDTSPAGYKFNFKDIFNDAIGNPAIVRVIADNQVTVGNQVQLIPDSELMFTLSPSYLTQGDWHTPGKAYDDVYLHDLDVTGNFIAKNLAWYDYSPDPGTDNSYYVAANITTHKTAYANGDITLDNSGKVVRGYPGYQNKAQILLNTMDAQAGAVKYIADGNITINEPTNVVISAGSNGPRLKAGGDIEIKTDGYFINWAGADAIQAGGRYLIYALDMLLSPVDSYIPPWYSPLDKPADYSPYLFFNTRYLDPSYTTAIRLDNAKDLNQLLYDTRGGLPGFLLWGYQGGAVPASGSGFIYTRHDASTGTGLQERSWLTPGYFAAQQRRQWAADTAQAGNAVWPGLAVDSATPAVQTGSLEPRIVDGGVALPADTDDTSQGKE